MYIQEVSIENKSGGISDSFLDAFDLLMDFYRGSGQTQGRVESQYVSGNKIYALPFTHEKNALDKQHNNFYVNRQLRYLEDLAQNSLEIKTLGKSSAEYEGPCACAKPSFYILETNRHRIGSPLICGSCNGCVPLYRIPVYEDHGYRLLLSWETNYQSCDALQRNCEVGERWALNQMQYFDSPLSKQGRELCAGITSRTQIPTYYFLHNYRLVKDKLAEHKCPCCGKKWVLKSTLQDEYDYKCDACHLISCVSKRS